MRNAFNLTVDASTIIVIRTAGERTFEACKTLVLQQVHDAAVNVVDERPFEASLRQCYRLGIESGAEWMITLDADVLLRDGAIDGLLAEAIAMPRDHFQIEGMVFDKLTNRVRWAGYRCYRCCHLPRALPLIPPDRTTIRPEHAVVESMASLGHPYTRSGTLFGVHDFEQYYRDIYRKARIHATKHQFLLLEMLAHWRSLAKECADFRIALRGAADGLISLEPPGIDQREFLSAAEHAMRELGLSEKGAVPESALTTSAVESIAREAEQAGNEASCRDETGPMQRLITRYRRHGPVRLLPYLLGAVLSDAGKAILKRVDKRG